MTARPQDTARDALIALQGQLIAVLAAHNAALAARVGELEAVNAELTARVERAASRNSSRQAAGLRSSSCSTLRAWRGRPMPGVAVGIWPLAR